jgi:hypothetical protein
VWLPGLGQEPVRDSIPFESLKGQLLMPVDRFTNLKTYEQWLNESKDRPLMGGCGVTKSLTIQSDSPMVVKNVAAGKVVSLFEVDGTYAVFVNHGKYYFVYCNLDSAFVKKDEAVTPGQLIGKILTKSYDGSYELELMLSSKNGDKVQDIDPYPWFAQSRYF